MKVPPLPESDFLNTKTTLCHIKLGAGGGGGEVTGLSQCSALFFFLLVNYHM